MCIRDSSNSVSLIPSRSGTSYQQSDRESGIVKPIGRPGLMAGLDGNVSDGVTLTHP